MTQEEKARAYDEALKIARKINSGEGVEAHEGWTICEVIFPELKGSEDERIRKAIIAHIEGLKYYDSYYGVTPDEMLAWLEKKNDTNETINRDEFTQGVLRGAAINLITWIDYNAAEGNTCLSNMECKDIEDALVSCDWDKIYGYIKKKLEKQSEQKPIDKVEPKFEIEEGKWYVCDISRYTDFIVGKAYYCPKNGMLKPNENEIARYVARDCFHPWTINDAKDGDVLVDVYGNIGIFEQYDDFDWTSYCSLGINGGFQNFKVEHENDKTHPATKEQSDKLEKAMFDAGYTFDFEKKELREIEKQGEQKSAWSTRDEMMLDNCLHFLKLQMNHHASTCEIECCIDWLKSLKQRMEK